MGVRETGLAVFAGPVSVMGASISAFAAQGM
jgi:hypothetical protein